VDYGNIILVGAPKSVTNKLQRVLNAAARIVTGTRKYDQRLSHLLHTKLHWLDVPERVLYISLLWWSTDVSRTRRRSICRTTVCQSLYSCQSSATAICLSSSASTDPTISSQTFGRRAFAVAGPTFWNSLADELQTYSSDRFKLALKTFLFATY